MQFNNYITKTIIYIFFFLSPNPPPVREGVVVVRLFSAFSGHLRSPFVYFRSASPSAFSSFSNLRVVVPGDAAEV